VYSTELQLATVVSVQSWSPSNVTLILDQDLIIFVEIRLFGPGEKYYIENIKHELDSPGEWYYDDNTQELFIDTLNDADPTNPAVEMEAVEVGTLVRNHEVRIVNSNFVNLEGVTLERFYSTGLAITGSDDIRVDDIIARDNRGPGGTPFFTAGISLGGTFESEGCTNVTISNSTIESNEEGIRLEPNNDTVTIENNTSISDNTRAAGVKIRCANSNVDIRGNFVDSNVAGIVTGTTGANTDPIENLTVSENTVLNSKFGQISPTFTDNGVCGPAGTILISNNFIADGNEFGTWLSFERTWNAKVRGNVYLNNFAGVALTANSSFNTVANNTFVENNTGIFLTGLSSNLDIPTSHANTLQNNLFDGNLFNHLNLKGDTLDVGNTFDYNNYWNNPAEAIWVGKENPLDPLEEPKVFPNLAEWQVFAGPFGQALNSLEVDPQFCDAPNGDYRLNQDTSLLCNAGSDGGPIGARVCADCTVPPLGEAASLLLGELKEVFLKRLSNANPLQAGTTYYVDISIGVDSPTTPGTEAEPFETVAGLLANITLVPGDTVLVKQGIYRIGELGLNIADLAGADGNPITIAADPSAPSDTVVFTGKTLLPSEPVDWTETTITTTSTTTSTTSFPTTIPIVFTTSIPIPTTTTSSTSSTTSSTSTSTSTSSTSTSSTTTSSIFGEPPRIVTAYNVLNLYMQWVGFDKEDQLNLEYSYGVDGSEWSEWMERRVFATTVTLVNAFELPRGVHTFEVRARDSDGNVSDFRQVRFFVVSNKFSP
jgi:parallel beta-helix repeat protein